MRLPAKLLDVRELSAQKEREYLVLSLREGPRIHAYRMADNALVRTTASVGPTAAVGPVQTVVLTWAAAPLIEKQQPGAQPSVR